MAINGLKKAVFLDKDGTLIENIPYNVDPKKIRVYEGVAEALQLLKAQGFQLIIVTNQPGVALGYFEERKLDDLRKAFEHLFIEHDVNLDGFYYCPHYDRGLVKEYTIQCGCRKPLPGMLHRAARDHSIDLSRSWMIGDILHDVEAGNRAGCRTILINNGNETEWMFNDLRKPSYTVWNMLEAAEKILQEERGKEKEEGYEGSVERAHSEL